jgi:hypothetical protein
MLKELDEKYHYLISQAESRSDWNSVQELKNEFESQRRNMIGDNSDESYQGNYYEKTFDE